MFFFLATWWTVSLADFLSSLVTHWRNCQRLREFEDRNLKAKLLELTLKSKEENSVFKAELYKSLYRYRGVEWCILYTVLYCIHHVDWLVRNNLPPFFAENSTMHPITGQKRGERCEKPGKFNIPRYEGGRDGLGDGNFRELWGRLLVQTCTFECAIQNSKYATFVLCIKGKFLCTVLIQSLIRRFVKRFTIA